MSMQDPIADLLCRVRNAQERKKYDVSMPWSKFKEAIVEVMKQEGYINDFTINDAKVGKTLNVILKYHNGKGVISSLKRVSKPSLRVYKGADNLPSVKNGLGEAIISTAQGVMTANHAKKLNLGGEVVAFIS